jgi:hypothetical protein
VAVFKAVLRSTFGGIQASNSLSGLSSLLYLERTLSVILRASATTFLEVGF